MELFNKDTMNAPWGLASRMKLVMSAVKFFNLSNYADSCNAINKTPLKTPELGFSLEEFLTYLDNTKIFEKKPNAFRVKQLLNKMVTTGILQYVGSSINKSTLFPGLYYFLNIYSSERGQGHLWLAPALGAEFIYHITARGIVHITGNANGEVKAGTGIIFHPNFILTCRHVVCDMKVDHQQTFQGNECIINESSIHKHKHTDIAVIQVSKPLQPIQGLVFQQPVITQTVFTLGYPKIPNSRNASLTIQRGEITNESVTSIHNNEKWFLYSAITRPGNSGGPIISESGCCVGIATKDLTYSQDAFSPHYAGIPSQEVKNSVSDLKLGVQIPFEHFE